MHDFINLAISDYIKNQSHNPEVMQEIYQFFCDKEQRLMQAMNGMINVFHQYTVAEDCAGERTLNTALLVDYTAGLQQTFEALTQAKACQECTEYQLYQQGGEHGE